MAAQIANSVNPLALRGRGAIGVRIAVGASAPDLLRMVLRQGMSLPLARIAVGLIGALGLTRTTTGLLFGTSPADPLTYVAVALTHATVALCACLAPAHRDARLDPLVALRHG
jgi:ABC-type antimicrobial peptide transport system permease subunit